MVSRSEIFGLRQLHCCIPNCASISDFADIPDCAGIREFAGISDFEDIPDFAGFSSD